MKESEFIELLNLYVDHEISAADAARLESEVMTHPGRRRIYRQYCSMDKACSLLAAKFVETASKTAPIEARPPRQRDWTVGIYATGLMAAACVALMVVVRTHSASPASATLASADAQRSAAVAPAPAAENSRSLAVYDRPLPLQSVVVVRDLLNADNDNPAVDALLRTNTQNDSMAWINRTRMDSLVVPTINFQSSQSLMGSDPSAVPASAAQPATVEMSAFRFQR